MKSSKTTPVESHQRPLPGAFLFQKSWTDRLSLPCDRPDYKYMTTTQQTKVENLEMSDRFIHAGAVHQVAAFSGMFPVITVTTTDGNQIKFKSGNVVAVVTGK